MDDRQLDAALDRLDKALARAETSFESKRAADLAQRKAADKQAGEQAAELAALQTSHAALKDAVGKSLRQIDEIIAGMDQ